MPDFTDLPIPYVPIADKATEVRAAIDAARLSAANSFGGLQKLAIPGPYATDAEANTFGVPDDNLYYRSDGTVRAASHISLDLAFALDKTLTARTGPTPTFSRASSGLFVNANGILVGKTAGTTTSITPSAATIGTTQVTVTVASGSVVGWLIGQSVSLIVDTDGGNDNDVSELWLVGTIVSMTATELVFTVTEKTATAGSATAWTLGYRGARFDHDPATGVCKGLLIEESRANLVERSEAFNDAYWSKAGVIATAPVVTADQVNSPSGIQSADRIVFPAVAGTNAYSLVFKDFSQAAGVSTTQSIYLRGLVGGEKIWIMWTPNGFTYVRKECVLTTSWQRFNLNYTSVSGLNFFQFGVDLRDASQSTQSAQTIFAWGAQVEAGAFPTSYIPTTSGTAIRSADVCSITGADFDRVYNQSELSIYSEVSFAPALVGFPAVSFNNQTAAERVELAVFAGPTRLACFVAQNNTTQAAPNIPASANQFHKAALYAKLNSFQFALNGVLATKDTVGLMPTATRLNIGKQFNEVYLNGHLKQLTIYRKALTDAKLQTLTAP